MSGLPFLVGVLLGAGVVLSGPGREPPNELCPQGKTCVDSDCHGNLIEKRFVHGPAAQKKCDACHVYSGEKHTFKLATRPQELCVNCHLLSPRAYPHEPVTKGECHKCHDPHSAQFRFLLARDPTRELCFDCHERAKIIPGDHVHPPAAMGACVVCHESHSSWHPQLLAKEGRDLCMFCHGDVQEKLAGYRHVHPPVEKGCSECHRSHSSAGAHLLPDRMETFCLKCHEDMERKMAEMPRRHGALDSDESCAACHLGHGSQRPKLQRRGLLDGCLSCHDREIRTPEGKKVPDMALLLRKNPKHHGPVGRGDCSSCHDPHVSRYFSLLSETYPPEFYAPFALERYNLCWHCHIPELVTNEQGEGLTWFRNGDRNLHHLHVNRPTKGRTCRTCHEVHASKRPAHIREWVPFGKWQLEIDFTQEPDGGTCSPGCHRTRTYRWEPELPVEETEEPQ